MTRCVLLKGHIIKITPFYFLAIFVKYPHYIDYNIIYQKYILVTLLGEHLYLACNHNLPGNITDF